MRSLLVLAGLALAGTAFAEKSFHQRENEAAGGATAPLSAFARDVAASHSLFDRLDTNRDGYLTEGELASPEALSASWIAMDRNQDGKISRDEFTALNGGDGVAAVTRRP
jgi:hypothetical protein